MATKKQIKKEQAANPTALPLFYKNPVALDKREHQEYSLSDKLDFSFAEDVNAVPINLIELPNIMQSYPVAFSATTPSTPLAILGLKDGENLFVNDKGEWLENTYIPAYVRRYPFIFAQDNNGEKLTLCIDDATQVLAKNKKRPLFDKEGEPTDMVKSTLEFCKSYQIAAQQTMEFAEAIDKAGILEERHAEIKTSDGRVMSLSGFRQVNERALKDLSDDTILKWHKNYWMRFIYAHLLSTGNWQKLFRLMEEKHKIKPKKSKK